MTDSSAEVERPGLAVEHAVRLKREALGLSKRELGRRTGLSVAYVSALESGSLRPGFSAFSRIAVELRLTPAEIFLLVQSESTRKPKP